MSYNFVLSLLVYRDTGLILALKEVAEATLAAMSNKYAIKQKGTWIKVVQDRSDDILT